MFNLPGLIKDYEETKTRKLKQRCRDCGERLNLTKKRDVERCSLKIKWCIHAYDIKIYECKCGVFTVKACRCDACTGSGKYECHVIKKHRKREPRNIVYKK